MAKQFGILAEFDTPRTLYEAAKKTSSKGYKNFDTYSPFPIHGMDGAMNLKTSKLGWIVAVGGSIGLIGALLMQWWMGMDYPYLLSGKEYFAYPAAVPVAFELMVLLSAFATVFGMFALNKLPMLSHPLFKSDAFRGATSDRFFLVIEASDDLYKEEHVQKHFKELGAIYVEVIEN